MHNPYGIPQEELKKVRERDKTWIKWYNVCNSEDLGSRAPAPGTCESMSDEELPAPPELKKAA